MVSKQLVEIIIKAQDQASSKANEVDRSLEKIGRTGTVATQSTNKFNESLLKANNSLGVVGNGAHQAANLLNQMKLDPNFGSTMDRAKLKVSQMGYDINSAKGKLMTLKTAGIDTFTNLSQKVSNAASSIKNKFSNAVSNAKNELKRLSEESKRSGQGFSYMKEALFEIGSNIATDVVYKLAEAGRASMEASSKLDYFAGRLKMSGTQTQQFRNDLDQLQQRFRKVDMTAVGASAEELAVKLGMGSDSLTQMSETLAVASSAFVAEGRTQEDAILAVSDAIDGQWAKLKELGITQEDIKNNGWNGDLNDKKSLLEGLNNTLEKMGFTKTAEDIVTLDDAMQALSVAGGILIQKVLVPLTPILLQIMGGLLGVTDAIGGVIDFISDNGWAQGAILIAALAVGIGLFAGALSVAAAAEGGLMALMPGFIVSLYGAASGFMAITVAGAPLWAIVAVVAAIAIAVYELGIAFGWWSDVGSMLDAIGAGLQRLWSAFINHPDVQAAIAMISSALSTLWSWIQQAGQAILEFFGISTGGEFDIVRALIDGIGQAWQMVTAPIRVVIGLFQQVTQAGASFGDSIGGFYNDVIAPFGEYVMSILTPAWQILMELWGQITEIVQPVVDVFNQFMNGQANLGDVAMVAVTAIWNIWQLLAMNLLNLVMTLATNLLTWATQAGWNFLTGVSTYLSQVPGRVYQFLRQTYSRIVSQLTNWVNTAKTKANQMVTGIINFIKTLPGKMLAQLVAAVKSIVSAGQQWVSNAKQKAKDVVDGVYNTLSSIPGKIASALSGVKDAIVKPFKDAYDTAKGIWDKIANLASSVPSVSNAQGGDLPMGGDLPDTDFNIYTGEYDTVSTSQSQSTDKVVVEENINLTLDFANVPSHIDTNTLIKALNDKNVLSALVNNREFQSLDAKVKSRIDGKVRRYNGV